MRVTFTSMDRLDLGCALIGGPRSFVLVVLVQKLAKLSYRGH